MPQHLKTSKTTLLVSRLEIKPVVENPRLQWPGVFFALLISFYIATTKNSNAFLLEIAGMQPPAPAPM